MDFLTLMRQRELVGQISHEDEFPEFLAGGKKAAYVGFDPTAGSLHVGHLLPVIALRRWQQAGHRAVVLLGGGTAFIGDPTGKTEMRQMMDAQAINENAKKFVAQIGKFVDISRPEKGVVVNNGDWLFQINYLQFLRDFGVHFSVNRMLTAESVKQRLEKGLSFLEFNYMLLQAYDFYMLSQSHDCFIQLGGDDQWSNMLWGMELIRKKSRKQAFCMTIPLLTTSSGAKMGKTEKGAVWLDPNLTSPYEFFQYFRNVDDRDVRNCLLYFTDLTQENITSLTAEQGQKMNEAKVVLAFEMTKLVHGEEEAIKAKDVASKLFGGGEGQASADAPEFFVTKEMLQQSKNLIDVLVASGVIPSKSEVRRLIEGGGLVVGGQKIADFQSEIDEKALSSDNGILVKKGKKHYYIMRLK
ncbi:MAG: tyrosine--tRNA ligase [Oligoflexales bacterium]